MHHSAVCVNAACLGFVVTGLRAGRSEISPDTPDELRVNVVRCI